MSGAVVDTHQRYMRQSAVIVTQPPRHISPCQVEPPKHQEEEKAAAAHRVVDTEMAMVVVVADTILPPCHSLVLARGGVVGSW